MAEELQFEKYVTGVDYPTHKDSVIRNAKAKDAPQDLINKLDRLPDRELKSKDDVLDALGIRTKNE